MTTLPAALERRAASQPERVCLWFDDQPVTYRELWEAARRAAGGLQDLGVGRGDRYAIFMSNSREFAELWLGGMLIGAIAVPINVAYHGAFLRHQLDDSGAKVIAVDGQTLGPLGAVADACAELRAIVVCDADETSATPPGPTSKRVLSVRTLLASAPAGDAATATPEAPATILYTSGTTGRSKGVVLSHNYLVRIGQACIDPPRLTEADTLFVPMPLFHVSGLQAILTPLLAGSRSVVVKRFSVSTAWETVRRYHCTGMVSVGPMLAMLMALPPDPSDRELPLRYIGTAPLPAPAEEICQRYDLHVQTMYGMTEAFPIAGVGLGEAFPPDSAGRLINEAYDVRIVDEDGKEVPAETPGEIAVRARMPHSMLEGYFGNPEATQAQLRDGWFYTGDIGKLDAEGYFYFVDRKKDALRRRGENISSIELELAIVEHPGVKEVAIHAVPSELGEDDVKAVIVPEDASSPPEPAELFAFFDEALPGFARPRYIEFIDSLPRNPVGRVQKFILRERGVTPTTIERP